MAMSAKAPNVLIALGKALATVPSNVYIGRIIEPTCAINGVIAQAATAAVDAAHPLGGAGDGSRPMGSAKTARHPSALPKTALA
jgi:hypothetical protein